MIVTGPPSGTNRSHCKGPGWITRDTLLPHMQRKTLRTGMSTGNFLSDSTQLLPSALDELACETTSLDPYAYVWDYSYNCVL